MGDSPLRSPENISSKLTVLRLALSYDNNFQLHLPTAFNHILLTTLNHSSNFQPQHSSPHFPGMLSHHTQPLHSLITTRLHSPLPHSTITPPHHTQLIRVCSPTTLNNHTRPPQSTPNTYPKHIQPLIHSPTELPYHNLALQLRTILLYNTQVPYSPNYS